MCAYTFAVFMSVFQLLPTAPYRILALGGSTTDAGLFLGFLTYASALSAPFTGSLVDRIGQRFVLISVSLVLMVFSFCYAAITNYHVLLVVVIVDGIFWSALLSASGAYITSIVPASRRAEGIGYWGLMSAIAVGVAPAIGFAVYRHGWVTLCVEMMVLNLMMAIIAWRLPDDRPLHHGAPGDGDQPSDAIGSSAHTRRIGERGEDGLPHRIVDWRVLGLGVTMGLISFGYGGLTTFSALFVDALHLTPPSLFLTVMAGTLVLSRVTIGRHLDLVGHRRVLLPCLATPAIGLALLAFAASRLTIAFAAVIFGLGFGLMYPTFTAYVFTHVHDRRRGAAYGAMLAAFDTGIGTGSTTLGWVIGRMGFRFSFGLAAGIALLALPYFLIAEKRLRFRD